MGVVMCVYHEGLRIDGVSPQEALALAVLPGFERGAPLLQEIYEHPLASDAWQAEALNRLAVGACQNGLLEQILRYPEDSGHGPEVVETLREGMLVARNDVRQREGATDPSLFHRLLSGKSLNREVALALGAMPGYGVRPTCLQWYRDNPGTSDSWQVRCLEKVARLVVEEGIIGELEALSAPGREQEAIALLTARLNVPKPDVPECCRKA